MFRLNSDFFVTSLLIIFELSQFLLLRFIITKSTIFHFGSSVSFLIGIVRSDSGQGSVTHQSQYGLPHMGSSYRTQGFSSSSIYPNSFLYRTVSCISPRSISSTNGTPYYIFIISRNRPTTTNHRPTLNIIISWIVLDVKRNPN